MFVSHSTSRDSDMQAVCVRGRGGGQVFPFEDLWKAVEPLPRKAPVHRSACVQGLGLLRTTDTTLDSGG